MFSRKIFIIIPMLLAAFIMSAADSIYFVGTFNGWNINAPLKVIPVGGIFEASIDFSSGEEFKFSTVEPSGSWTIFDQGTLYASSSVVKEDEWFPIQAMEASPNVKAPGRRPYNVKVDLDNMTMLFSTGATPRHPWSGTLPVMFVNTEDKVPVTSKETYVQASYWLDPMGMEGVEAIGSEDNPELLQIRGRGNYTWIGFDKKPYRIKLDKKTALLGMNKSKHFALLAHADDQAAGLRNALGFAASETLGMPWTPATQPLEVVLNGDYIGLYWLTETIRVDKDRVDIEEQNDLATEDVDGGWLVEIDNYDTDPHVTVMDSSDRPIWFTYKSPEILSREQESYLQTAMQSIQNALANGDSSAASSLVDFDILARYFITNQIMLDMESFHGSCYLNRQRGVEEKWKFGPVWDFGNAFAPSRADHPRFIFDCPDFSQVWIGQFYEMPPFIDRVRQVWNSFLSGGPENLKSVIEADAGRIAAAAVCDARRWPKYAHSDVEYQASKLQDWLEGSIDWLKEKWGSGSSVDFIPSESDVEVRIDNGSLIIHSPDAGILSISRIDGTLITIRVYPGSNIVTLPSGFYILEGRKLLL